MLRQFMLGKLHRAVVTRADLDYVGSVSVDSELLKAVGILPYEKVLIVNVNTGARFETYAIEAPAGSRTIGMNGGCAHLAHPGDICLIIAFAYLSDGETIRPKTAIMGEGNEIVAIIEDEVLMPGVAISEHCSN
ncbi:MAG: aspartate 1-decarboxylase [bacterium]